MMRRIAYPYRVRPDEYVDFDASRQGLTESRRPPISIYLKKKKKKKKKIVSDPAAGSS